MTDSSEELTLDLNRYNRGMASAAIKVAIQEVLMYLYFSNHYICVILENNECVFPDKDRWVAIAAYIARHNYRKEFAQTSNRGIEPR